jgi:hypothetical protein
MAPIPDSIRGHAVDTCPSQSLPAAHEAAQQRAHLVTHLRSGVKRREELDVNLVLLALGRAAAHVRGSGLDEGAGRVREWKVLKLHSVAFAADAPVAAWRSGVAVIVTFPLSMHVRILT